VLVCDLCGGGGLALEAGNEGRVVGERGGQGLDGHEAIQRRLAVPLSMTDTADAAPCGGRFSSGVFHG